MESLVLDERDPRTYERQVAPALMYALTPLLKKIYKDPEDLRDAYNRHLTFWNTDAIWGGSTISGITASLEEQRAKELTETGSEQTVSTELIEATKVGLMWDQWQGSGIPLIMARCSIY